MSKVGLLFEDLAGEHFTKARVRKYRGWVENANKARNTGSWNERLSQYDKAEDLVLLSSGKINLTLQKG